MAVKNIDKTHLARMRALTKETGEKFFAKFMAEVILENDRMKIETSWNEKYNGSRVIDYNKIPIAFPCAKLYKETVLDIRPEKREAIGFHSITGSSLIAYGVGVGKANLLTSDILTPNGWVKMGDINPGMRVIGKNGHSIKVLAIYPQGIDDAYRVTFSDKSFTEVTGDHLWEVQTIHDRSGETKRGKTVLQTKDMIGKLQNYRGNRVYSIPMVEPVHFEERGLLIDPYLMGILLGDGGLTKNVTFSNPEKDIQKKVRKIVEDYGLHFNPTKSSPEKDFAITKGSNQKKENLVFNALKFYGLIGKKSIDKFIPEDYLYNTVENRLKLLHGLMDTDGYMTKTGVTTQFSTSSKKLAEGLKELIQSFGGTVNINTKHPYYTYKGEKKKGQLAYIFSIRLPEEIIPFSSKKHLVKYKPKTKYFPVRFIESIESIGKHEAQCISVEAEDNLYVCDQYIVTHNTWSAIFAIAQALENEYCKRPFIVVPNQVYKQFTAEIKEILPNVRIYDLYNLSTDFISQLYDENGNVMKVEEGSISIMTYQGFERIGYQQHTQDRMFSQLTDAISMLQEMDLSTKAGEKAVVREGEKIGGVIGTALSKSTVTIEDLGFDFVCFDEAHAMKKIFSQVKAKSVEGKKQKKMYEITAGKPSATGIKGYFACSYIQMNNSGRNVLLLTATPFTNSPLEVYSMLSMVAYTYLREIGLSNINDFFDNYCEMSYELVINSKLKPERKQIFKAFDNLVSLQKLVYKYMLYKGTDEMNIKRPDKWMLPYKGRLIKNKFVDALPEDFVDTVLTLTEEQKLMMDDVIAYVEGTLSYATLEEKSMQIADTDLGDEDEGVLDSDEIIEVDESNLDSNEKAGVRTLRGVGFAQNIALSPFLYKFSGLGEPGYKDYIEKSPKLNYVMSCIKTVIDYHKAKGELMSGQIIYMNRGKKYFDLIKEYLVKELGFEPREIGMIRSGEGGKDHKEEVMNAFNGYKYDEKIRQYKDIPDEDRMKVIIGTASMKEGMNLQRYSTVLYNAYVDWNPTDQIQLEGRMWRQGNTFMNVRVVLPMMADSMDIFLFEKLEQKTRRINSIWNYDGQTNVLPVEELDPKEQKIELIRNPYVIAELKTEGAITELEEQRSLIENNIQKAGNISQFIATRDSLHKDLAQIMEIIAPEKVKTSTENMAKFFEATVKSGKIKRGDDELDVDALIRQSGVSTYSLSLVDYSGHLSTPWDYGRMKGSIAMLKKAKRDFLDKYDIKENKDALDNFIENENRKITQIQDDISNLKSEEYLRKRAFEIEQERAEKKITFASVSERVEEFKTLNYLLSLIREDKPDTADRFIYEEIEGCPPLTDDGERDTSAKAIKKLEKCIAQIPQTKALHFKDGQYTKERVKLHNLIKGRIRAKAECVVEQKAPIAILTGGVPGSGKTYFLKNYAPFLLKENIFKIDADAIREELPEYKGWNASATHLETRDIYMSLLDEISKGQPCKYDILWDGTMNKAQNYLPLIGKLQKLGYKIYVIFVQVPWDVSRKRVIDRYKKSGRYVTLEVVDEANKAGLKGFDKVKALADGYMLVDGVTGEITDKSGEQVIDERDYFKKPATDKDKKMKIKLKQASARKRRIEILKLKNL